MTLRRTGRWLRTAALAALVAASVVGVTACADASMSSDGAHGRTSATAARGRIPLGPPPPRLAALCERAVRAHGGECPGAFPRPTRTARTEVQDLTPRGYRGYLLSVNLLGFRSDDGGHMILGSQPHRFVLSGNVGQHWPARAEEVPDAALKLPLHTSGRARLTVLRHIDIAGPALVMRAAPYPAGGVHGGHVVVLFNAAGRGQLVSLHFVDRRHPRRFTVGQRITAAVAIARSE